jgi:uncharacterized protein YndB with AHSA1/START domain
MKFDVVRQIGAVTREVASREHEGRLARVVVATRTYDTNVEDVWDAITSAERIPRWFLPISGDLRLGGRFQLEGNAGGEITRCEPPHGLAVTWEFGGSVSWVTVRLAADGHWEQFGPGAVGVGWDLAIMGLERHLTTGAVVDRQEATAWFASDHAKAFMRRSSETWCEAAIAGGLDAAAARAAAARTMAAYTGDSPPEG